MSHSVRKHAKLSASGAERWTLCTASVQLNEGLPDKDSIWSREGTTAHELLEMILIHHQKDPYATLPIPDKYPREMVHHVLGVVQWLLKLHAANPGSELLVETAVSLAYIHPDIGGTFDSAIVDLFGTLHVVDFKYGQGHPVSPTGNLQMVVYGLGLAKMFDYNFKEVKLWIVQPRIKGFAGPVYWKLSMEMLRQYELVFANAVKKIETDPQFAEGPHCHFCKGKAGCPLKLESKMAEGKRLFKEVKH